MIVLNLFDDPDYIDFNFKIIKRRDFYYLFLFVHKNKTIKSALSDSKRVELLKRNFEEDDYYSFKELSLEDKEYLINLVSGEDILNDVIRYECDFKRTDIENFVMDNPELNDKTIVIGNIDINDTFKLFKLISSNRRSLNKFHVYCLYKNKLDTLMGVYNDFREYMNYVNRVDSLDLSPMEKVLYLYETIREEVFYTKEFAYILYKMGFKPHIMQYTDYNNKTKIPHHKVFLRIKDKKYGIDGTFCFDPTFDAVKNDGLYLNKLEYFAKDKEIQEKEVGPYERITNSIFIKAMGMLDIAPKIPVDFDSISAEKTIDLIHIVRTKLYMEDPNKYDYNLNDLRESYESNKPIFENQDETFDSYVLEKGYDVDLKIIHQEKNKTKDFNNK